MPNPDKPAGFTLGLSIAGLAVSAVAGVASVLPWAAVPAVAAAAVGFLLSGAAMVMSVEDRLDRLGAPFGLSVGGAALSLFAAAVAAYWIVTDW